MHANGLTLAGTALLATLAVLVPGQAAADTDCSLLSTVYYGSTQAYHYCGKTAADAITYENLAGTNYYEDTVTISGEGSSCAAVRKPTAYGGSIAPLDADLSVHIRGPIQLRHFAAYYPSSSGSLNARDIIDALRKRSSSYGRLGARGPNGLDLEALDSESNLYEREIDLVKNANVAPASKSVVTQVQTAVVVVTSYVDDGSAAATTAASSGKSGSKSNVYPTATPQASGSATLVQGGSQTSATATAAQAGSSAASSSSDSASSSAAASASSSATASASSSTTASASSSTTASASASSSAAASASSSAAASASSSATASASSGSTPSSTVTPSTSSSSASSAAAETSAQAANDTSSNGPSCDSSSSGSGWYRKSFYESTSQKVENLVFMGNHGQDGRSGFFDTCVGNSLSYLSSDGTNGAASAQVLKDVLTPTDVEYSIFSGETCDDSCGYYDSRIPGHKGFAGASKLLLFEFMMPNDIVDGDGINNNMPAVWLLNGRISRVGQYSGNSCWATGCGEFDLFETLRPDTSKAISCIHSNQGNGNHKNNGGGCSPYYFDRPTDNYMIGGVLFTEETNSAVVFTLDSFDWDCNLSDLTKITNLNGEEFTFASDKAEYSQVPYSTTVTDSSKSTSSVYLGTDVPQASAASASSASIDYASIWSSENGVTASGSSTDSQTAAVATAITATATPVAVSSNSVATATAAASTASSSSSDAIGAVIASDHTSIDYASIWSSQQAAQATSQ